MGATTVFIFLFSVRFVFVLFPINITCEYVSMRGMYASILDFCSILCFAYVFMNPIGIDGIW